MWFLTARLIFVTQLTRNKRTINLPSEQTSVQMIMSGQPITFEGQDMLLKWTVVLSNLLANIGQVLSSATASTVHSAISDLNWGKWTVWLLETVKTSAFTRNGQFIRPFLREKHCQSRKRFTMDSRKGLNESWCLYQSSNDLQFSDRKPGYSLSASLFTSFIMWQ